MQLLGLGRQTALVALCFLALSAPAPVPVAATLPRVASTDLCADLLLLQIGAPEQILSVSRQSQDPGVSPVVDAARAYRANRGTVEDLLYLKPDIALVFQGWTARRHADLLARQGTRVIALPYPQTWADALGTARRVAAEIGRAAVGEAKAAEAERRMAALARPLRPVSMLYLRPSGGTAGTGTYVDDLIARLGLRNLATEQGLSGWGRFPLERLAMTPPDVLLLGYFDQPLSAARSAYGRHPMLRAMLGRIPTIDVTAKTWGCGGLELVEAAERIAAGIHKIQPRTNANGRK